MPPVLAHFIADWVLLLHGMYDELERDRFWRRVDISGGPDACWPWKARRNDHRGSYGIWDRRVDGKRVARQAHRVAYEMRVGPIPEGLLIRHTCDNPPCCNPAHLIPGTAAQNSADMVRRGRHWTQTRPERIPRGDDHWTRRLGTDAFPRGEQHHGANTSITVGTVEAIQRRYTMGGCTHKELAVEFNLPKAMIGTILRGEHWRHEGAGVKRDYETEWERRVAFLAAGGSVEALAEECGISPQSIHAFKHNLRKRGASIPDGRRRKAA